MRRYLLFDAGCAVCHHLAQAIEEAAEGKLEAVSLRERRAVKWLDRVYPAGWAHRPYLVTVDGERVRAYAGLGMALRLGWLLGPRNAWHVWRLAKQADISLLSAETNSIGQGTLATGRRKFMKTVLGTVLATTTSVLFGRPILESQEALAQSGCGCLPWWCGCFQTSKWTGCTCYTGCHSCPGGCHPDYYETYECICGIQCGIIRYCTYIYCSQGYGLSIDELETIVLSLREEQPSP